MTSKRKNTAPQQVRASQGTSGKRKKLSDKQALGERYVAASATSAAGAAVKDEAAAVRTSLDTITILQKARPALIAALRKNTTDTATAVQGLDTAIGDYTRASAKVAGPDAAVLKSLGVDEALKPAEQTGPAPAPTEVSLEEGKVSGSAHGKWKRPRGVAAFLAQYMLEPPPNAPPGLPPPQWLPPGGYATKKVEWDITGLPPAAPMRLRVCSIGAEAGAWSEEALGKTR